MYEKSAFTGAHFRVFFHGAQVLPMAVYVRIFVKLSAIVCFLVVLGKSTTLYLVII